MSNNNKKKSICKTPLPKHLIPQTQEAMVVIGLVTLLISQSDSPLMSGIIIETLVEMGALM